jgi:hypothetical protein
MKKIKIPKGEGFKRLENLIQYQLDNFDDFELRQAREMVEEIKTDSDLTKKEKDEMREQVKWLLKIIGDFTSLAKRVQEGIEIEATEDEFTTFLDCVKRQLELSEGRLEDFREDRFGWGKSRCQILIDDETIFHTEMTNFYKTLEL